MTRFYAMLYKKHIPTYVDLDKLIFIKEIPYKSLHPEFLYSHIIRYHILPENEFSIRNAKSISIQRFRAQPHRSVHTVMPEPTTVFIYKHIKSGKQVFKFTYPKFRVYTFFKESILDKRKQKKSDDLVTKLELGVSVYFTPSGHLSYVQRLNETGHYRGHCRHRQTPRPRRMLRFKSSNDTSKSLIIINSCYRAAKKNASPKRKTQSRNTSRRRHWAKPGCFRSAAFAIAIPTTTC